jgi:diguanylate cyclase (GGDEF)-like protein
VAGFPVEFAAAASLLDRELEPQRSIEELTAGAHQALVNLNLEYESVLRRLEQVMAEKELVADELRAANARLSATAATDSLTELPNNRAFREALARELARSVRAKTPVSLIMADIDFFKRVNDTYGHAAGDETLRAVAQRLRGALRAGDMPARYGGEEFVVLLPVTEIEGARVVAERLRNAIAAAPVVLEDGTSLPVTASFGVAVTMAGPPDSSELFNRADSALYVAKRGGRNRVEVERSEAARPSELTAQCVA